MTNERTGMIQTVLGLITPNELGITQTHEHLLVDTRAIRIEPTEATARRIFHAAMSPEISAYVRHYGMDNLDSALLDDIEEVIEEVSLYKQYGGQSIVEVTSGGIGRDPVGLARISRTTGLNIIAGASYYVDAAHPPEVDEFSEDKITETIIADVTVGANGTGIKSGVIGEVGCSWPLTDNERKVLRASGRAQVETGAPILVHPGRNPTAPMQAIDILRAVGVDTSRIIMAHIDRTIFSYDRLKELAETGCYLEWDLFGTENSYYSMNPTVERPSDGKRMDDIAWAIGQGYGERIVIAQDTFMKHQLIRHGGFGYQYILAHIVPRMRARGFSQEDIDRMLVHNPAAVLAFIEPGD
jgi:phosphotriesterase-related protein